MSVLNNVFDGCCPCSIFVPTNLWVHTEKFLIMFLMVVVHVRYLYQPDLWVHTEKFFLNLVNSNKIMIVITRFRLIQQDSEKISVCRFVS